MKEEISVYRENFLKKSGGANQISHRVMRKSGKDKEKGDNTGEKKEGGGPPALRVMAPDTNTWVREKGPSPREEGIVYSDYMGSGPGNKPSHGGNGYKIGSMVATVLSRLGLEARPG